MNNNKVEGNLRTDDDEKPSFVLGTDRRSNHVKTNNTEDIQKI